LKIPKTGSIIPKVGTTTYSATGLAGALFSRVQQRVLGLLFGQPDRSFLGAELIRLANSGTGAVHRELTRLAASGLVTVTRVGNQKHYRANPDSPLFEELSGLVRKTFGLAAPLREALSPFGGRVRAAFIYGSVAKGEDRAGSDIDLMVLSDELSYPDVYDALHKAERQLDRRIDPNIQTPEEWKRKRRSGHAFTTRVAEQPKLFVVGSEDDLD
jgi:predicted nucleotidyltransferase